MFTTDISTIIAAVPELSLSESSADRVRRILNAVTISEVAAKHVDDDNAEQWVVDEIRRQIFSYYEPEILAGLVSCQLRNRLGAHMAANAQIDVQSSLATAVFEHCGLSPTIANIINRAGFETQVAALIDAICWVKTKVILENTLGLDIFPLLD